LVVGQLDQFAKLTFEEETEIVTQGAVSFQVPAEIAMYQIRGDGLLLTRQPERVGSLAYPWPEVGPHEEVFVEVKMPGDHLGPLAIQRALLRRQARQVQRVESTDSRWLGEEPLWVVAPRVPAVLAKMRGVQRSGRGCYRIGLDFPFLWIAANELPLQEELIPFLIARSGRSMLHFLQWVAPRRPTPWFLRMLQYLPMSPNLREELLRYFPQTEDPEMMERQRHIAEVMLKMYPEAGQELSARAEERGIERGIEQGIERGIEEGRIAEARSALRRVLERRGLAISAQESAQIEACADLPTLEHWLDEAVLAPSAAAALH
jgi:hypothetical protein